MNTRAVAAKIITELVTKNKSLAKLLPQYLTAIESPQQKALIQEFCYGTCRWFFQLEFIAHKLLTKPLKPKDKDIHCLILIGLYQLLYLQIPPHAAVSETVQATKILKKNSFTTLVNAILRNFLRQKEQLVNALKQNEAAYYAHPQWLLAYLQKVWPNDWQTIVAANNQRPPMSLRINRLQTTPEKYLVALAEQNIKAQACCSPVGITLAEPCDVTKLPGFAAGKVSVQDCGAQFAAHLLDLQPKQIVLDACAAPGGKTTHILETQPELAKLIALDNDQERLQLVKENLGRLNLTAELICADAAKPKTWWQGELFDRILLDAPCSATGVIRRHPDIKLLRQSSDIETLAQKQLELLLALWPLLKSHGKLLYITCSILPEENEATLAKFLNQTQDATILFNNAPWGITTKHGRQILSGQNNMDGFYYALLEKN